MLFSPVYMALGLSTCYSHIGVYTRILACLRAFHTSEYTLCCATCAVNSNRPVGLLVCTIFRLGRIHSRYRAGSTVYTKV
jgi:hypothetical protein